MIRTAVVGALSVSLLAGVAPSAQAQGLGSLGRNIFSCGASGNTQVPAAAIGGVLGALGGAGVAKNDTLGGILGAVVGAAAGSWIGCKLQGQDQVSLEEATVRALNEGRSTTWSNPSTGASARINVMADSTAYGGTSGYGGASTGYAYNTPRYGQYMAANQVRLATRISNAGGFETVAPRYTALTQTYIRTSPSLRATTNGTLTRGQTFDAIAKVQGQPWILVGRNGYGVGYVPEDTVRAIGESVTSSTYAQPISRTSIRLNTGVGWASAYETAPSTYTVRSNAYLRATPSLSARQLGQVYRGSEVEALAKVQGQPWVLVGRNGYGIGYVHESVLDAVQSSSDYAYNNGYNNGYNTNPGYQATSANCRIVEQIVTTREYSTQTQRYRACRDTSGSWNFAAV